MISSYVSWTISLSGRPCKVSQRFLTKNLPQQRFTSTRNVWLLWNRNNSQHVSYLWKQNLEVFKQFELRRQGTNVRPRWRPTRVWNFVDRRDDSLAKGCGAAGTVSGIVGRTAARTPRIVAPSRGFCHSSQDIYFLSLFGDLFPFIATFTVINPQR